jgi:signal transduction histidine kinase
MTAVILVVASLILYVVLRQNLVGETDSFLQREALDLAANVRITGGPGVYQVWLPARDRFLEPNVYAQIIQGDGQVLDESPAMGQPERPLDPAAVGPAMNGQITLRTSTVQGLRLRVLTIPMSLGGNERVVLEVAQDFGSIEQTLDRLARLLVIGDAGVILIAAAFGWWMSGSALRPIVRTTRAVQAIGESQKFDRRVDYDGPADEVGELVYTFNRMLDRLQASVDAQRRFVADASHELRTPLTTLRVNVELLRRDPRAEPPERSEILDDIAKELERLSRLVHGLLDLARADAGYHLEKQPVRADELVLDVYHQVKPSVDGVALKHGELVPVTLPGNPDYLKQLLLSLVDNALKYTPSGGEVRLDLEQDGRWLKLIVADTGRGIDPDDLPNIFDRFYRARSARSQRGTGLGLAVAWWIAQEHGGYIDVESAPGRGSVFSVWLPLILSKLLGCPHTTLRSRSYRIDRKARGAWVELGPADEGSSRAPLLSLRLRGRSGRRNDGQAQRSGEGRSAHLSAVRPRIQEEGGAPAPVRALRRALIPRRD